MPKYDFACERGHEQFDVIVPYGTRPPCPECGGPVDILWRSSFPNVIGDEMNLTTEDLTGSPETFTSKAEHRRRVKELGLRIRDHHVSVPGTDRNPNVSKWY